ncbi:hypothetical protein AA0117_g13401 [Alternaria alternata]|jgi:exonuclease 3'-5' domain-containing protein 1|uniref:3'-5' exonuclease domain-containing protein n=3 Tax=Alternaria alternata complex TaxID=187734 RepID=A0A4Q4MI85_ALTAL|nr:hypothetical protein AA0115_g12615 [Alternaria tenuissima]RYN26397.1 hypothetical protein AA0114_g12637 [Alternaria tenuissima]RYN51032.1 hypothetical protein AA0117_g13401 [Alternaria alternata]RYO45166.1 hypothetical protein AA0116_g13388 [Alternaria tenuissima]
MRFLTALGLRHYLIDVYTLGAQTFTTAGTDGPTLKDILEDPDIPKVFFDVRNDSDALFAHYGIALQSVEDVQLMESATRRDMYLRKHLSGLAKYMEKNITVGNLRRYTAWLDNKIAGEKLFKAEHGGSYEVFNKRPLPEDIIAYCAGDVQCLPELRNKFWGTRSQEWRDLVREETKRRVASTHMPDYRPYGKDKALAPWNDEQNKVLDRLYWAPRFEDYTDDDDDYDEFSNAADDGDDYY